MSVNHEFEVRRLRELGADISHQKSVLEKQSSKTIKDLLSTCHTLGGLVRGYRVLTWILILSHVCVAVALWVALR